ncbi:hypothetical protein [Streptomyces sp. NPDC057257]
MHKFAVILMATLFVAGLVVGGTFLAGGGTSTRHVVQMPGSLSGGCC